ncbi:MAG: transketolase [Clostridiales bacterium]|jgi:transketolase|nr:transketolase [Clostridiales bacterium]
MQKAYIKTLYDIMSADKRVCSLLSDSGTDYDLLMARDFPAQCFNFGIAEQNKVAVASGMAKMGKIPFVYTTDVFLAYRAYEFIRDDVCFQRRNVKVMGMGMGMGMGSWSTLGPSHHSTEALAALRALPSLTLLCAATPLELTRLVRFVYETNGPVYLRFGMSAEEELFGEDYKFELGKPIMLLNSGTDVTIFVTGTVAAPAYHAAKKLRDNGIAIRLYNMPTLKPIDDAAILDALSSSKYAFTVEEHSLQGGLGGAIAEILAEAGEEVPLKRLGLDNCFAKGYGTTADVRKLNGLDTDGIYNQIVNHINGGKTK